MAQRNPIGMGERGGAGRGSSEQSSLCRVVLALLLGVPADVSAASAASGVLRTDLPNHTLTPGALNPAVTQATILKTICVSGWTTTVRPSSSYTTRLKRTQLAAYGYHDRSLADYEEDHLVSLELGGSPASTKNLWPEPHHLKVGGLGFTRAWEPLDGSGTVLGRSVDSRGRHMVASDSEPACSSALRRSHDAVCHSALPCDS